MTHANTHPNFRLVFKNFPCVSPEACPVIGGKPCAFNRDLSRCEKGQTLKARTTTICDSGVFTKEGQKNSDYRELFKIYRQLGVQYGVIIDVLKDANATLASARRGKQAFDAEEWPFELIGVAQGKSVREYVSCYQSLKKLGYNYIAVGGMLRKKFKSARYVQIREEGLLREVLKEIRKTDPEGWLFALGCYSPRRHSIFVSVGVAGADYKGWIFQYKGRSPRKYNRRSQASRFRQVRTFIESQVLSRTQVARTGHRLLVVGCSRQKTRGRGKRQAIGVYDGPTFRLLRKYLSDFSNDNGSDVLIVSAKYGLIEPRQEIQPYNQLMTKERALELRPSVFARFRELLSERHYDSILVNLGRLYLPVLGDPRKTFQSATSLVVLDGRIGERLHQMKEWVLS